MWEVHSEAIDVRNNDGTTNYDYWISLHFSINISQHVDNQHHSPASQCECYEAVCVCVRVCVWQYVIPWGRNKPTKPAE